MSLVEWHALVAGLLLAAGGLTLLAGRWRVVVVICLAAGAVGYGLHQKLLFPADLTSLAGHAGLEWTLMEWLAWAFFAVSASSRATGPIGGRFTPVLLGALFGELGGAVLSAAGVDDARSRARRVLAASAGALLTRVGDPAVLLMGAESDWRLLVALLVCGALGTLIAWPPPSVGGRLRGRVLLVGVVVALVSLLPVLATPVLLLGGLILFTRRPDASAMLHVVGMSVLLLVAVAAGSVEHIATLLEAATIPYERQMPQVVASTGALAGLVLGSGGGGALGVGVLDRALALRNPDASTCWAVMAAVSGLGPLALTRTVWRGLPRHLLWILVCLMAVHGMVWLGVLR